MKTIKKIIFNIVQIPNYPFVIIFGIFLFIKLCKENGFHEVILMDKDKFFNKDNKELVDYITHCYPPFLTYGIAALFYGYILIQLFA